MAFSLPPLPYDLDALDPYISRKTLEFHHGKHHQTYVNNLNGLIPGGPFESASLEEIVLKADGPVFNNAAQVWNHQFFFDQFHPTPAAVPSDGLRNLLGESFGSVEAFQEMFSKAAVSLFGSGWAWLVLTGAGKAEIVQESNAGNPLRKGLKPLLTCDVWEHAYYLDYQNRRPDFVQAFWKILDWKVVDQRLKA